MTKKKLLSILDKDYKMFEKKYLQASNDRIAYGIARIMGYIEELENYIKSLKEDNILENIIYADTDGLVVIPEKMKKYLLGLKTKLNLARYYCKQFKTSIVTMSFSKEEVELIKESLERTNNEKK